LAQRTIDNPVVRKLGDISYGLYLWHCLVIGFCVTTLQFPVGGAGDYVAKLAVVLSATIALAWITHVTIERPAIEWARRRTAARRATGPRDETRQLA
jgi:peptidoglycan/LPS O-acetylase OafA/YrhL